MLGFDSGPDIIVRVIEAEFHRQCNESPGRWHKARATLHAIGFQNPLNYLVDLLCSVGNEQGLFTTKNTSEHMRWIDYGLPRCVLRELGWT